MSASIKTVLIQIYVFSLNFKSSYDPHFCKAQKNYGSQRVNYDFITSFIKTVHNTIFTDVCAGQDEIVKKRHVFDI